MNRIWKKVLLLAAAAASSALLLAGLCACDHSHEYGSWVIVTPPTCTEPGLRKRTCTVSGCSGEGYEQTEVISATGHLNFGAWKTVKSATCTEGGLRQRVCLDCGFEDTDETNKLGHDWDSGVPIKGKEATCTKEGLSLFTCNVCGETEERTEPILPHEWISERVVDPTCTQSGEDLLTCAVCGKTEKNSVDPLNHKWDVGRTVEEADCLTPGKKIYTCTRCKDTMKETIPALNHSPEGDYTIDVRPDFGKKGSKSYHCLRCGEKLNPVEIPALEENTEIEYEFRVVRSNGEKLTGAKVRIEVYDGEQKVAESTNSTLINGVFKANLLPKTYTVRVFDLPKGYTARESYQVIPQNAICKLYLTASPIRETPPANLKYAEGDILYDFTVTDVNGRELTLSTLLETKKMVMLNFWYINCPNCEDEFPGLQKVYERFQDEAAVIAINDIDNQTAIVSYANRMGFTFNVVCDNSANHALKNAFGVNAYPVTIVIDREGIYAYKAKGGLAESDGEGGVDSSRMFTRIFERFCSDDYIQSDEAENAAPSRIQAILPEKRREI